MDNYTSDEDIDDDFDTQLIIQQSLQDIHKPGTACPVQGRSGHTWQLYFPE